MTGTRHGTRVAVLIALGSLLFHVPTLHAYRTLADTQFCIDNGCTGARVAQQDQPFLYRINQNGSDDLSISQVQSAIQQQFGVWSGPSCTTFSSSYGGLTSRRQEMHDGHNVVVWVESSWAATGAPSSQKARAILDLANPGTGWELVGADIALNGDNFRWQTTGFGSGIAAIDLAALHEVGHLAGIEHPCEPGGVNNAPDCSSYSAGSPLPIMWPHASSEQDPGALTLDDARAICGLYPGPTSCVQNGCGSSQSCDVVSGACESTLLPNGQSCSSNGQCHSGHCVDGRCCSSACSGACEACSTAAGSGANGRCDPVPSGQVCRSATGPCDVTDTCNGSLRSCPADRLLSAGTECRPARGVCDVAEVCSGSSATCPVDALRPAGAPCRPAVNDCDVPDRCTGSQVACPADQTQPNGAPCEDGLVCTGAGMCSDGECTEGASVSCPDDGDACTDQVCVEPIGCMPVPSCCSTDDGCDDGRPCTVDTCDETGCVYAEIDGCCEMAAQCDDGDPGTADWCQAHECQHADAPTACLTAAECDDGDRCTVDWCQAHECLHSPAPECPDAGVGALDAGTDAPDAGTGASDAEIGSVEGGVGSADAGAHPEGDARAPSPADEGDRHLGQACTVEASRSGSDAPPVSSVIVLLAIGLVRRRRRRAIEGTDTRLRKQVLGECGLDRPDVTESPCP